MNINTLKATQQLQKYKKDAETVVDLVQLQKECNMQQKNATLIF